MKKTSHKRLFWAAIAIILLLGIGRILTSPTESSGDSRSPVIISEFMAANQTTLADEDGDYADWIELHNRSLAPVNLFGWSLTNDPDRTDKWLFPEITLGSGERLVVFASGKDRAEIAEDGASQLHTNFQLNAEWRLSGAVQSNPPAVHGCK